MNPTGIEAIDSLVEEYNRNEREQSERLRKLFFLLKDREGYRQVRTGTHLLFSNCWDGPDRTDNIDFDRLGTFITEVTPGHERETPRPADSVQFVK